MMNYANFYPGGFGGAVYQQAPMKPINFTQAATKEELEAIKKQPGGFNLNIPQEEFTRAYCTHRKENKFTFNPDDKGHGICSQCGKHIKLFNGTPEDAREITENFLSLLETAKVYSLTMPPEAMRNYFQYEPFARRLPELYEQGKAEFERMLGVGQYGYEYAQDNNAFNMYNSLINPMGGIGYYDPGMMYGGAQPQYQYGQPMNNMMPNYGQPVNNMMPNYGQPMNNMMPNYGQPMNNMMPNYGYQQQPSNNVQGNPFDVNSSLANNANKNNNDTVTVTKPLTD